MNILRSLWRDTEGAALVEGAILLPFLFVLMLGIFEFSWFIYQQHMVSAGLREAARYLTRAATPCEPSSEAWNTAQNNAKNLATTGYTNGSKSRISGWRAGMISVYCTAVDNPIIDGLRNYRGEDVIYTVTVSTRFNEPSLGFFRLLGFGNPVISLSYSQRVIGPG